MAPPRIHHSLSSAELDHPLSPFSYALLRSLFKAYYLFFHCVRISGEENIPLSGPVIIAPNHNSYYDPPLVGIAIPRRMRFMAWNALFRVPVLGWGIRKLGAFAVDPKQPDAAAYKQSLLMLHRGDCIAIFPEGKRGLGQELEPFESGVARLAIRSGATIVPATLTGVAETWPRWHRLPRPFRAIQIKFHAPIHPQDYNVQGEGLRAAMEEITNDIRRPIDRRFHAYRRLMARKGKRLLTPPAGYEVE